METIEIGASGITASRTGLSTEAIGNWAWGGKTADLVRAMSTIPSAIERGITLIHTAPVYGFGLSERIVGSMLSGSLRERAIIATQTGLEWRDGRVLRNSAPSHVTKELGESLRRLRTDRIDLYIVQWPDPLTPICETAKTLARLLKEGKIRAIGVANYSPAQMDEFRQAAPIHAVQVPYNLFEREAEASVVPYARRHNLAILCHEPRLSQYTSAAATLDRYARTRHGLPLMALALRWVLDQGKTIALCNAARPEHLEPLGLVDGPPLGDIALRQIEKVIGHAVKDPIGPRLLPPPSRSNLPLVA